MERRIVGHLDMDAFFAAVEERDRLYLKGKPIVIGADPKGGKGRGVVSTASYAARKYGIGSATPITKAWEYCKEARKRGKEQCVFITGGFRKYGVASREVFSIVEKHVPIVQKVSVDEAYLDLSFCGSFTKAKQLAEKIKKDVKRKTKLTCSIGIGPNKLIAKIASDYQKPNSLTVVTEEDAETFLEPLQLRKIPGIGPKAMYIFKARGIQTVHDAKKLSWEELGKIFGKWGFGIYEKVRGTGSAEVRVKPRDPKSIGKHHTFMTDTFDMSEVLAVLREQTKTILERMKKKEFVGFRTVVLTVRFDDFVTRSRSSTNKEVLRTQKQLEAKAAKLLLPFFEKTENPKKKSIRLIGLRVEKLEC